MIPITGCRRTNHHGHEFVTVAERATIRSRHPVLDEIGLFFDFVLYARQPCWDISGQ
jgi:hypothetical protein